MSSHREAPEISKDPVADSTDVYAFVSPDRPDTVTLIANYLPLQDPFGGPNFFEFGDDVLYRISIDNNGDGRPEITYDFEFTTRTVNPRSFLYNTGPIDSLTSSNFNRRQTYSLTERRSGRKPKVLASDLRCPPCNVGPRSTPDYAKLAASAVHRLDEITVFAGQRLDGFFVDLGAVFDLATLRPFQNLHLIPMVASQGRNALRATNVHTLALQIPIRRLTADGRLPRDPMAAQAVLGVHTSAHRQRALVRRSGGDEAIGPFVQVSRLGNPLFNEVLVPLGEKDRWNTAEPHEDSRYAPFVARPELAKLLPALYPGTFPNLAAYNRDRADLLAILLTGLPAGVIPGFQNAGDGTQADLLRLNVAVPPATEPNVNGILGGDLAGFPNGRRVFDDVVTVELRAVAGASLPLVDKEFKPDPAAALVTDGAQKLGDVSYLDAFPYLDHPVSGYDTVPLAAG